MTNASFLSQNDKVSCAGKGWERALSSGKLDVHGLKNGGFHFNDSMKNKNVAIAAIYLGI